VTDRRNGDKGGKPFGREKFFIERSLMDTGESKKIGEFRSLRSTS